MAQGMAYETIANGISTFRRAARYGELATACSDLMEVSEGVPGVEVIHPRGDSETRVLLIGPNSIRRNARLVSGVSRLAAYSAIEELPFFHEKPVLTAASTEYKISRHSDKGMLFIEFDEESGEQLAEERAKMGETIAALAKVPASDLKLDTYTPNLTVARFDNPMDGNVGRMRNVLEARMPMQIGLRAIKILPRIK